MGHCPQAPGGIPLPLQRPISVREYSNPIAETALLLDLNSSGIRFISPRALDAGAHLQITVQAGDPGRPPMEAAVSVLHCQQVGQGFDIAAAIEMMVQPDYFDTR